LRRSPFDQASRPGDQESVLEWNGASRVLIGSRLAVSVKEFGGLWETANFTSIQRSGL